MRHEWTTRNQCSLCLVVQTPELENDDHCSGGVKLQRFGPFVQSETGAQYDKVSGLGRRPDGGIAKEALRHGQYYFGRSRNADIARWDAMRQVFAHWRQKFGDVFLTELSCREDEAHFDVFDPFLEIGHVCALKPIPITEATITARQWPEGVACNHPGCLSHVSHPCEGCGRIAGRYPKSD